MPGLTYQLLWPGTRPATRLIGNAATIIPAGTVSERSPNEKFDSKLGGLTMAGKNTAVFGIYRDYPSVEQGVQGKRQAGYIWCVPFSSGKLAE